MSCFFCLEFWSFGIVSDFVLRISNLPCQIYGRAIVFNLAQRTRFSKTNQPRILEFMWPRFLSLSTEITPRQSMIVNEPFSRMASIYLSCLKSTNYRQKSPKLQEQPQPGLLRGDLTIQFKESLKSDIALPIEVHDI